MLNERKSLFVSGYQALLLLIKHPPTIPTVVDGKEIGREIVSDISEVVADVLPPWLVSERNPPLCGVLTERKTGGRLAFIDVVVAPGNEPGHRFIVKCNKPGAKAGRRIGNRENDLLPAAVSPLANLSTTYQRLGSFRNL